MAEFRCSCRLAVWSSVSGVVRPKPNVTTNTRESRGMLSSAASQSMLQTFGRSEVDQHQRAENRWKGRCHPLRVEGRSACSLEASF